MPQRTVNIKLTDAITRERKPLAGGSRIEFTPVRPESPLPSLVLNMQLEDIETGEWIDIPTPLQLENFTIESTLIETTLTGFIVELIDPNREQLTVTQDG